MTNKKNKNGKYPWAIITKTGRIARTENGRKAIYRTRELARAGNLVIDGKVVPRYLALEEPGQFFNCEPTIHIFRDDSRSYLSTFCSESR